MQLRMGLLVFAALACAACGRSDHSAPASSPPGATPTAAPARVVNIYNWADYVDPNVLEQFERESGIKVNYDTFDSQEMLETKLLTGKTGYDVVVVAGSVLERLIPTGVFRELDAARLPGLKNLDPTLMAGLARHDPGNRHAAGYLWGTTGIGYDAKKLKQFAPDAPTDSWALFYDPKNLSRLAGCGVSVINAPSEVIATALAYAGKDVRQPSPADLQAAAAMLGKIRRYVRKFDSDSQIQDLVGGDICVMLTWTTNVVIARQRATEAGAKPDFHYVIPREGTISWFDTLAIPADAPHVEEAYAFLEFLLRPEIAAKNANFVGNATFNRNALPQVDAALRDDPTVYPPPAVMGTLQPMPARSEAQRRAETDVWRVFRSGK